jgi:hypothetical protein
MDTTKLIESGDQLCALAQPMDHSAVHAVPNFTLALPASPTCYTTFCIDLFHQRLCVQLHWVEHVVIMNDELYM